MTKDIDLAKEWAAGRVDDNGIVNVHEIDLSEMKILDLVLILFRLFFQLLNLNLLLYSQQF